MIILHILRSILIYIVVFFGFILISLVLLPLLWIIGLFSKDARERTARCFSDAALSFLRIMTGSKSIVIGAENVPDEAVLFVANHRGYFDIVSIYPFFHGRRLGFVGKKEFTAFLPFRLWMEWIGCLFIDRDNPREGLKAINAAAEDIQNGKSIWIYPEGTRGHEEDNLPFHAGSFRIAEKAGCKIVPAAQCHADDVFEKHIPLIKPAKIITVFGKPYSTEGLDRQELRELYKTVEEECRRLYNEYK